MIILALTMMMNVMTVLHIQNVIKKKHEPVISPSSEYVDIPVDFEPDNDVDPNAMVCIENEVNVNDDVNMEEGEEVDTERREIFPCIT